MGRDKKFVKEKTKYTDLKTEIEKQLKLVEDDETSSAKMTNHYNDLINIGDKPPNDRLTCTCLKMWFERIKLDVSLSSQNSELTTINWTRFHDAIKPKYDKLQTSLGSKMQT